MKTNETELDRLTRSLLAGTAETPPPSLNLRIMSQIFRERRLVRKIYAEKTLGGGFWLSLLGYIAAMAVAVWALYSPGAGTARGEAHFSLLTAGCIGSIFFFFYQLNNYLSLKAFSRSGKKNSTKTQGHSEEKC